MGREKDPGMEMDLAVKLLGAVGVRHIAEESPGRSQMVAVLVHP
jgi:hypothetical protein